MTTRIIKRGDLYYTSLLKNGSVQGGERVVLIYSNNLNNTFSPTVNVIPLTSKMKELCVHVVIKGFGLKKTSMALLEQITTIDKRQLDSYIGTVDECCLKEIDKAADIQFGRTKANDNKDNIRCTIQGS